MVVFDYSNYLKTLLQIVFNIKRTWTGTFKDLEKDPDDPKGPGPGPLRTWKRTWMIQKDLDRDL
jgi:hypothetical protein